MSQPPRVHLVPHTHWDREWYRSFQSFRMQLVDMIDRVLDMLDADPTFRFTLDGQLATVDDYLEIRPDAEPRIRAHVASGRLAIGPWLVLMDEFLVSGENMVRNLERGQVRARDFGEPMPIGYLPDMFGHVAQMPQILRRAGIADSVVWRGVPAAIDRHQFRWIAPDGSAVRTEYLPAGYGNAASLFAVPDEPAARLARFRTSMEDFFGDDPLLAMYGTDHTAPVPELAALVGQLNELDAEARVRISTLADYVAAAPALGEDTPEWHGELRAGARANVLMGVASARIDQKAAAARAERLLERYAEPLSALWVPEDAWPAAFLDLAWRRVIENSAHDSVCGCSVDAVADQVAVRFAEADQVAGLLAGRAVAGVAGIAPLGMTVVMNPSPVPRSDQVLIDAGIPDAWEQVALELPNGDRLATETVERHEPLLFAQDVRAGAFDTIWRRFHGREVFDRAWNGYLVDEVRGQPRITFDVDVAPDPPALDVDALRAEVEAVTARDPGATWHVRILARPRRRLLARVPAPALGWTAVRPVEGQGDLDDAVRVEADGRGLGNGALRVRVADDGTLRLETIDGIITEGVGRIVDGGDAGDSYNYGPPPGDRLVDVPSDVAVRVVADGPLRASLAVERAYEWPTGLAHSSSERSADSFPTLVTMHVELRAGEPFARIAVSFENRSVDHRVRFHVPTPVTAEVSHAEGQFAVVERGMAGEGGYREVPLATYPARGFVDAGGMAVLLDHVLEYELLADGERRELALTLLRATGLISRNDHPYREDPAGPEIAIPGAQGRGPWRVAFALFPHPGSWTDAGVLQLAERYQHPFLAAPGTSRDPQASAASASGLSIEGEDVVLSALHRRGDGWVEVRVVNASPNAVRATLRGALREAREASIVGRPGGRIGLSGDALELALTPWEIRTVQVRRDEPELPTADVLAAVGPRLPR